MENFGGEQEIVTSTTLSLIPYQIKIRKIVHSDTYIVTGYTRINFACSSTMFDLKDGVTRPKFLMGKLKSIGLKMSGHFLNVASMCVWLKAATFAFLRKGDNGVYLTEVNMLYVK